MKWEQFNQLTPAQQKEYKYKFWQQPQIHSGNYFTTILMFKALFGLNIMILYLIGTNEAFANLKQYTAFFIQSTMMYMIMGVAVILTMAIVDIYFIIYYWYKKKQWRKANVTTNSIHKIWPWSQDKGQDLPTPGLVELSEITQQSNRPRAKTLEQ